MYLFMCLNLVCKMSIVHTPNTYLRASLTGELNEKSNVKKCPFSFYFSISSLQCMRQTDSYFSYLLCEEPFLHFTVEMAKINDYWQTVIFIDVGQHFSFFFFKYRRKEFVDFKILYYASPFSQI